MRINGAFLVAALAATGASCGDVARQSRAPVYLILNSLQAAPGNHPGALGGNLISSVLTLVTQPPPCTVTNPCQIVFNDVGSANFSIAPKDIGPAGTVTPSSNNSVTITRYHVAYNRADCNPNCRPGIDVPWAFDGAATGTVTGSGTLTLGFEIVRHAAKEESPLVQLLTSPVVLTTIASVTFYGNDVVGNAISVTGQIQIDFGNFANN